MFQRIVQLWNFLVQRWAFLRKSKEEQKAELFKHRIDVFEALDTLNSAEKQALLSYVKDLYNDLMEIEVLRLKVNLIAKPLLFLFSIFVWLLVLGLIGEILNFLLSFLFSTD